MSKSFFSDLPKAGIRKNVSPDQQELLQLHKRPPKEKHRDMAHFDQIYARMYCIKQIYCSYQLIMDSNMHL